MAADAPKVIIVTKAIVRIMAHVLSLQMLLTLIVNAPAMIKMVMAQRNGKTALIEGQRHDQTTAATLNDWISAA